MPCERSVAELVFGLLGCAASASSTPAKRRTATLHPIQFGMHFSTDAMINFAANGLTGWCLPSFRRGLTLVVSIRIGSRPQSRARSAVHLSGVWGAVLGLASLFACWHREETPVNPCTHVLLLHCPGGACLRGNLINFAFQSFVLLYFDQILLHFFRDTR